MSIASGAIGLIGGGLLTTHAWAGGAVRQRAHRRRGRAGRATVSPGHYARIEVQDNDGPWTQAMTDPARHHGLDIIRAVADAWGSDADPTTRTIWARSDWPGGRSRTRGLARVADGNTGTRHDT